MSDSSLLAQIQPLLSAPDPAQTAQGVELLVALDRPDLFDVLLDSVRYEVNLVEHASRSFGGLIPNRRFSRPIASVGHFEHALVALLAAAPDDTAAAQMRAGITSFTVGAVTAAPPHHPVAVTSLAYLDRFPALTALCVRGWNRLEGWDTLARLSTLEVLHLEAPALPGDLSALSALPALHTLVIETPDHRGLTRLPVAPKCQRLTVRCSDWRPLNSLDLFADWSALEVLRLRSGVTDLGERFGGPTLKQLWIRAYQGYTLDGLERSPNLEVLQLSKATGLSDASALVALPALRQLRLGECRALPALPPISAPLERLELPGCPAIRSLPDMPGAVLDKLNVRGCLALRTLPRVALAGGFTRLDLSRLPQLTDVSALSTYTGLVSLSLRECTAVEALPDLSSLKRLRTLDLRLCRNLHQIGALPGLRVIAVHGSRLRRSDFPPSLQWAVTVSHQPDLLRLSLREPPDALPPMNREARDLLEAVRQRDAATIRKILDAGPAVETAQALLYGTRFVEQTFLEGFRLRGARNAQPHLCWVLLALLACSPDHQALRDAIVRLDMPGGGQVPADLSPLRALANLKQLALLQPAGIVGEVPAGLQELAVLGGAPLPDLRVLKGASRLKRLLLVNVALASLDGVETLSSLERLELTKTLALSDTYALAGHGQLTALQLSGCPARVLEGVHDLPALRDLHASALIGAASLEWLHDLPLLSTLSLRDVGAIQDLTAVEALPALTGVDLSGSSVSDVSGLTGAPHLEVVKLNRCAQLTDISALARLPHLRALEIGFCRSLTDISALVEAPALESIWLRESGVRLRSLPEALRWLSSRAPHPS